MVSWIERKFPPITSFSLAKRYFILQVIVESSQLDAVCGLLFPPNGNYAYLTKGSFGYSKKTGEKYQVPFILF
jgi:hypothetical protein